MRVMTLLRTMLVAAMIALPLTASAQDATIGGTITDTTGGAPPRAAGTATQEATGHTFNTGTISFGKPHFSGDAIAEFEFVSNRFDASQGRSSGIQVNAVTKSGTNVAAGTFSGYFRDDKLNAADPIAKRVLPYQDQQLSG